VTTRLSPREAEVTLMLAAGLPAKVIADRLGISTKTVRTYITHVHQKLGTHSILELGIVAMKADYPSALLEAAGF
jgi:DNA-binding CsgD family transcriptional regulator